MTKDKVIDLINAIVQDKNCRVVLLTAVDEFERALLQQADVSGSLPSDEKLKELAYEEIPYNDDKRAWWMRGAQFVRDMLGGNDR